MATEIEYTDLLANGGIDSLDTETLDAADGHVINDAVPELTVLVVENTSDAAALDITVVAGDYPPALAAGLGDLVFEVGTETVAYLGPFESGRFLNTQGQMVIETSAATGTIAALRVPRNT